jgi:hypothetical protein
VLAFFSASSFNDAVRARDDRRRHSDAKFLGALTLMVSSKVVGCCIGRSAGLAPLSRLALIRTFMDGHKPPDRVLPSML